MWFFMKVYCYSRNSNKTRSTMWHATWVKNFPLAQHNEMSNWRIDSTSTSFNSFISRQWVERRQTFHNNSDRDETPFIKHKKAMQHFPVKRMEISKIALTQWNQNKFQTNIDINRLNQLYASPTRKGDFINTITVNNRNHSMFCFLCSSRRKSDCLHMFSIWHFGYFMIIIITKRAFFIQTDKLKQVKSFQHGK